MYEYRQIIYRLQKGQSAREISRETPFGRNKIKEIKKLSVEQGWLSTENDLPSESSLNDIINNKLHPNTNSSRCTCLPFESLIKQWVSKEISCTVIHRQLRDIHDYQGSYHSVQRFVKKYKLSAPPKMTVPLNFKIGEAAQVDFGQGPPLYDERVNKVVKTWYFVMTLCWSGYKPALFSIKSRGSARG